MKRRIAFASKLALLAVLLAGGADRSRADDDYPSRSVTFVVGQAAGGGNDTLARMFAEHLTQRLGRSVVVDNRVGAGGAIAASHVAKSAPDGYTIMLMTNSNVVNQYLHSNPGYDVRRDFAPISLLVWAPLNLIKSPSLPVKTLSELVTYAKANPGKLSFGSSGVGSLQHISGEMLKRGTGIDLVHVPYRGTAPSISDLMSGRLPLIVATTVSTLPLLQGGKIQALATADSKRSPVLPNVPSYKESGFEYQGYDLAISSGIAVPAGTPPAIVGKLSKAIQAVAAEPSFRKRLQDLGYTVVAGTPEAYVQQIDKDVELFGKIIPELKTK